MEAVLLLVLCTTLYLCIRKLTGRKQTPGSLDTHWNYSRVSHMLTQESVPLPAMMINLDVFDRNTDRIFSILRNKGKTLRIATKSIRVPFLIKRVLERGAGICQGLMCYSIHEAKYLHDSLALDDFFIPYPCTQRCDLETALTLHRAGVKVTLTVDSKEHVTLMDQTLKSLSSLPVRMRIAVDLDMSFSLGPVRLGAHRSAVNTTDRFLQVVGAITNSGHLRLAGVIGYEASVAGLPDDNPHGSLPNVLVRVVKKLFYRHAVQFRSDVRDVCKKHDIRLEFFNGGGSGNIDEVCDDPSLTEVTTGSCFLQAQLFDYYVSCACAPALVFGLSVARVAGDYVCCQSGGYVASGNCSEDKHPAVFNSPVPLQPYPDEGFGEVQTPLKFTSKAVNCIKLGDPLLFRPAKSGEIAEHFSEYHVVQNYRIVDRVKTYRGLGMTFY